MRRSPASHGQTFFQTAIGKQILLAIGKVMATASGKTLVVRTIHLAVAKVMASAAMKAFIVTTIKKVGIGILIKTVIGKAVIASLAIVGLAHIPVVWIILPLLAAFLAHEYFTFPKKLANRVPGEVVGIVKQKFAEINNNMARNLVGASLGSIVEELTKIRKTGNA